MSSDEVVVDASLAVKWAIEEPYSAEARLLLENWRSHKRRILAPTLFLYEIANALAKRIRRGELALGQANERLQYFVDNRPTLRQTGAIHLRALELVERLRLPTAYDAHYVALAEIQRCEFWTADERLWNSVKRQVAWVRWIGEQP